ncbi:hypothetical protein EN918_25250, partial [Mesorhizobium sp. M7A.F.Ca.CA.004.05.1.1]
MQSGRDPIRLNANVMEPSRPLPSWSAVLPQGGTADQATALATASGTSSGARRCQMTRLVATLFFVAISAFPAVPALAAQCAA